METLKITKNELNANNEYIGSVDVSNFDGHIEIAALLGYVKFKSLKVAGSIIALAGSGIEAGDGIEAGWGIEAGDGIKAGWGIEAGSGIKAGLGIEAGWGILCKTELKIRLRAFAGLCSWRLPSEEEKTITCGKFIGGTVEYGILNEIGMPNTEKDNLLKKADELIEKANELKEQASKMN